MTRFAMGGVIPASECATADRPPAIDRAALRATFRMIEDPAWCWADITVGAEMQACRQPEASDLGLCARHLTAIFGLTVAA